MRKLK
jgi:hypothetical protein